MKCSALFSFPCCTPGLEEHRPPQAPGFSLTGLPSLSKGRAWGPGLRDAGKVFESPDIFPQKTSGQMQASSLPGMWRPTRCTTQEPWERPIAGPRRQPACWAAMGCCHSGQAQALRFDIASSRRCLFGFWAGISRTGGNDFASGGASGL